MSFGFPVGFGGTTRVSECDDATLRIIEHVRKIESNRIATSRVESEKLQI